MKAYRIKDWDRDRENAETRKYVELIWFRSKVKLLGEGIGHTLGQEGRQGPFLYGMFKIIEQIAAGGKAGERGWLVRKDSALTAERMANLTRLPKEYFTEALDFFTKEPMDWLEFAEFPPTTGRLSGESPSVPPTTGRLSGELQHPKNIRPSKNIRPPEERDKKGAAPSLEASKLQWSAVSKQIKELEGKGSSATVADKQELRRLRAVLREIEKNQAAGDFQTVQTTGGTP